MFNRTSSTGTDGSLVPQEGAEAPELVFGLVGAIGSDLRGVESSLSRALETVGCKSEVIQLIDELRQIDQWSGKLKDAPRYDRIESRMDAGDAFRRKMNSGEALAVLATLRIQALRKNRQRRANGARKKHAYIVYSLKHPDEVHALRRIYGRSFLLVGAYSPREQRLTHLAQQIARSKRSRLATDSKIQSERLASRDERDRTNWYGQNVQETFPLADVFVDAREPARYDPELVRFIQLLFGNPFLTPTPDEFVMFHAQNAALRSAALTRQVGAAISINSNVISVGTNEVPKAGGGLYWPTDEKDARDFVLGYDTAEEMRSNLLQEMLLRLQEGELLHNRLKKTPADELLKEILPLMNTPPAAGIMRLNEFGRTVHAEMAAIMDAASTGLSVRDSSLYTSTFPCHECARHIIAAGIRRVVYIEPYPKSFAYDLHADSILIDAPEPRPGKVHFEPFVGIAPRQYSTLFLAPRRKEPDGSAVKWKPASAEPKIAEYPPFYRQMELESQRALKKRMDEIGLAFI